MMASKDFWSGMFFLCLGLFVSVNAVVNYDIGTAFRMGPGYFPLCLGILMGLLGFGVVVAALLQPGERVESVALRPVIVVVGCCIVYGYFMQWAGLVISTALLTMVSASAGHEFRFVEVSVLAGVVVLFCALVFVWGLGLPLPLWPQDLR